MKERGRSWIPSLITGMQCFSMTIQAEQLSPVLAESQPIRGCTARNRIIPRRVSCLCNSDNQDLQGMLLAHDKNVVSCRGGINYNSAVMFSYCRFLPAPETLLFRSPMVEMIECISLWLVSNRRGENSPWRHKLLLGEAGSMHKRCLVLCCSI